MRDPGIGIDKDLDHRRHRHQTKRRHPAEQTKDQQRGQQMLGHRRQHSRQMRRDQGQGIFMLEQEIGGLLDRHPLDFGSTRLPEHQGRKHPEKQGNRGIRDLGKPVVQLGKAVHRLLRGCDDHARAHQHHEQGLRVMAMLGPLRGSGGLRQALPGKDGLQQRRIPRHKGHARAPERPHRAGSARFPGPCPAGPPARPAGSAPRWTGPDRPAAKDGRKGAASTVPARGPRRQGMRDRSAAHPRHERPAPAQIRSAPHPPDRDSPPRAESPPESRQIPRPIRPEQVSVACRFRHKAGPAGRRTPRPPSAGSPESGWPAPRSG